MYYQGVDYPVRSRVDSHHTVPQTGVSSSPTRKRRGPLFALARRNRKAAVLPSCEKKIRKDADLEAADIVFRSSLPSFVRKERMSLRIELEEPHLGKTTMDARSLSSLVNVCTGVDTHKFVEHFLTVVS
ncbi:hypothetical protein [Aneurinibacillus migulanus]|uniref:hypothetical protein n=1 Tax=Aneurinibacillus migulanus TaxID=47500 RepID=UPI00209FE4D3|nr:hypothetical protein [Aneurinibacillus migulanus]MCP1356361.1 hypothetical protein [Aneurinibacillus migulanus]